MKAGSSEPAFLFCLSVHSYPKEAHYKFSDSPKDILLRISTKQPLTKMKKASLYTKKASFTKKNKRNLKKTAFTINICFFCCIFASVLEPFS